jgi:hypothetical protein
VSSRAGFWLKVNDTWVPLPGVQAGVGVSRKRNRSSLQTVGGYNSEYQSRRAPREWSLDFTHATPAAVAVLMLAANGQAGDVWLLSSADARANMLDPLMCVGSADAPVLDCQGLPLRSVVLGESVTRTVTAAANATLGESTPTPIAPGSAITLKAATPKAEGLLRFAVPADTAGRTLESARLLLTRAGDGAGRAITAHAVSNAWMEAGTTWANAPAAGSAIGGATESAGAWAIDLAGAEAFRGTDLSVRLKVTSGLATFATRGSTRESGPKLALTYSVTAADHAFSSAIRGGHEYWLSVFTDADAGDVVVTFNDGSGPTDLRAPSGTGPRQASTQFRAPADGVLTGIVHGDAGALVAGLRLTEGPGSHGWLPGHHTPCRAAVIDPEQTLSMLLDHEQGRSSYAVAIKEVR